MENKKIDVLFGVAVIAFLVVMLILIKEFNDKRVNDYKEYSATISSIVKMKNNKIKVLANALMQKERENADLRNTLGQTRNDLEALSKRLAPVAPEAAPVTPPAAAAVPVPAPATK